jgi:tRNA/tmRNA/rRNA uracil-C5-methylase (TrmA/RlmC/RlmD family)
VTDQISDKSDAAGSIAVGQQVELRITDIAFGGEGVGRVGEFVLFTPFVALGELVRAEVIEVKKNFGRAKLVQVIEPSPDRVQPPCPYFGLCGGCQYQHIDYPAQLALKKKQVSDLFERVGGLDTALVKDVLPCPQPYGYRNRIMIRSQWDKPRQALNIGYVRADCGLVVDIEECGIAEPALSARIKEVRANPPPRGGLKVVLRIPPEGWEVPPDSFFQNNFFLLPGLVGVVRDRLQSSGTKHLADIYCGVGFFSIELSGCVETYVGVELDAMAIRAARRNAEKRGAPNGEFVLGSAEGKLPEILRRTDPSRTTVLLDPPRKGCYPEMLQTLRALRPAQVIYVSCQPATMARDLNILCAEGVFKVEQVRPLDMFPQTAHVECVADLRLAGGA